MDTATAKGPRHPAAWEAEWRVVAVVHANLGLDVTPETRLVEIGGDSLDLIELVMELEEGFQVRIPDKVAGRLFTGPATLRSLTQALLQQREITPLPARPSRRPGPVIPGAVEVVPFTQLGPTASSHGGSAGPLYEPMGRNGEGHVQYRRRTDGMRCVLLPRGEVWLGNPEHDAPADECPLRRVEMSPFLIDAEPVSNAAFARFLQAVGKVDPAILREWCGSAPDDRRGAQFPLHRAWFGWQPLPGTEKQPMILVSWYGANAYSLWANRRDWRCYRGDGTVPPELRRHKVDAPPPPEGWLGSYLPSEAQWEYAARGPEPRRYPWGDEEPEFSGARVACHRRGSTYAADSLPVADVCARLGMSPFGLHHMAGNVWQWCRDWDDPAFYHRPEAVEADPQNALPSGIRSERGGSWVGPGELSRCAYRRGRPPQARGRCLGLRCVGLPEDLPRPPVAPPEKTDP